MRGALSFEENKELQDPVSGRPEPVVRDREMRIFWGEMLVPRARAPSAALEPLREMVKSSLRALYPSKVEPLSRERLPQLAREELLVMGAPRREVRRDL